MGDDQKRTFLAISLSALILFGWNYFFPAPKSQVETSQELTKKEVQSQVVKSEEKVNKVVDTAENSELKSYRFSDGKNTVVLNSQLSITEFISDKAVFDYKQIIGDNSSLGLELEINGKFQPLFFTFAKVEDQSFEAINETMNITVLGSFDKVGKFVFSVQSKSPIRFRFFANSTAQKKDNGMIRSFVLLTDDLEKMEVGDEDNSEGKIKWLGIDFNYHLLALTFPERHAGYFATNVDGYLYTTLTSSYQVMNYSVIFTKKEYDNLIALGDNLKLSVDFGLWSLIAVPMLRILQFFHEYVSNYGLAIIFLTLIMRLLMFPLQYKSFQGMKKMQEIQPELTKIREKFKDDPARLQQESMLLFKRAGANPLGGCLPLLMQMPFFFAFYKVLFNSVELVGAPFVFWIKDLSVKDPYFVLPVLMGLAMFFQQKLTPSPSADPTQKKVLMFMPVIFAFIMSSLPAGLTLYILISTIFGVVSQTFVFKKSEGKGKVVVV